MQEFKEIADVGSESTKSGRPEYEEHNQIVYPTLIQPYSNKIYRLFQVIFA